MSTPSHSSQAPTWSSTQYLKFNNERTRPVHDLLTFLTPLLQNPTNPRIYDLGCGPGNSTSALLDHFPDAHITGLDSSPDMLKKARATLPDIAFEEADLESWTIPKGEEGVDLLFSNAVFHWLRHTARLSTLQRLFSSLTPSGVLAFQVPDNYHAPTHTLMRTTATLSNKPSTPYFADAGIGNLSNPDRPDLDPIEAPNEIYDALMEAGAAKVDIWRTEYMHILEGPGAIVEWVRGTGLMPYLEKIKDGEGEQGAAQAKEAFLGEYERRLGEVYKPLIDGRVMLGYPRLFVVAVKK